MPELPRDRAARFQRDYGLGAYDAAMMTQSVRTASYFEAVATASQQPKLAANWIMGEVSRRMNAAGASDLALAPEALAALIVRIADRTISNAAARQLFDTLWDVGGGDVDALIDAKGLRQMGDSAELERIVDAVIAGNAKSVAEFRAGKEKAFNALVGQAMKASRGKADPGAVGALLRKKLG
jgi:aspartyl-tRNA(Asn)/glutamyl-tRNA(Gln) amidotransferase subunit B